MRKWHLHCMKLQSTMPLPSILTKIYIWQLAFANVIYISMYNYYNE